MPPKLTHSIIDWHCKFMKKTILLLLFFLYSCIKPDDTVFKVTINDFYSNTPISNYEIEVFENSNWERTVKYFATNENGQVEYTIPYEKNSHYSLGSSRKILQPNNWLYSYKAVGDLPSGQTNNIYLRLKKLSFLKLELVDSTKNIFFIDLYNFEPFNQNSFYKGRIIDTTFYVLMIVPEQQNGLGIHLSNDSSFDYYTNAGVNFYSPKVDTFYYRLAL